MFQVMSWISNVTCCGHLLCSMIWSESWLFVLLILVKLLTVLLSFHNEHKLCCTLLISIFSLSGLNNLLKQSSFLPCQTLAIFWRNTFKPGTSKPESYKHYWMYLSPFFFLLLVSPQPRSQSARYWPCCFVDMFHNSESTFTTETSQQRLIYIPER